MILVGYNSPSRQTAKYKGHDVRLPASVQEIADVIGTERALYLIGQLPKCYQTRNGSKSTSWHVILYIPKRIEPDHQLVKIMGWHDATRLVDVFGGEILQPANCTDVYRQFRDRSILRMVSEGMPGNAVAALMGVSDRHVRNLVREKAQEDRAAANDNTPTGIKIGVKPMKDNVRAHA